MSTSRHCNRPLPPLEEGIIVHVYQLVHPQLLELPYHLHLDLWFFDQDNSSGKHLINRTKSVQNGIWNQDLLFLLPSTRPLPPLRIVCQNSRPTFESFGTSLGEAFIDIPTMPLREAVGVPITHSDVLAGFIILSITPCTEAELMDVACVLPCSILHVDRTDNDDAGGEDVVGVAKE